MSNRTSLLAAVFVVALIAFAMAVLMGKDKPTPGKSRVVEAADVDWQMLNPLRGDKSPKAGTLWGDRQAPVPCGFLVTFIDGFSSPPHIHPVTYRGVVISGLVHNDDPEAEEEWLAPGTFWTQPAGEVHITAAQGKRNVAYIEIEKGPYLVHPAKDAFDPTEEPIKLPPSKLDWRPEGGAQVAVLPGNPGNDTLRRHLVKLPAGFKGSLESRGPRIHAVVIQGLVTRDAKDLDVGSYFGSEGGATHALTCDGECLVYVRSNGDFTVASGS